MREYRRAVGAYALHDCEGGNRSMLKTDYDSSGYVTTETTSIAATQRANAAPKRPEADVWVLSQSIELERKTRREKLLPDHILESHVGH